MNDKVMCLTNETGSWVKWEDYARLKADLEKSDSVVFVQAVENERLKAEYERLRASSFVTAVPVEEYEKLKAEVEHLTESRERQFEINHELDDLCTRLKAEVERLTIDNRLLGEKILAYVRLKQLNDISRPSNEA